jgi:hypothetical protein
MSKDMAAAALALADRTLVTLKTKGAITDDEQKQTIRDAISVLEQDRDAERRAGAEVLRQIFRL